MCNSDFGECREAVGSGIRATATLQFQAPMKKFPDLFEQF